MAGLRVGGWDASSHLERCLAGPRSATIPAMDRFEPLRVDPSIARSHTLPGRVAADPGLRRRWADALKRGSVVSHAVEP